MSNMRKIKKEFIQILNLLKNIKQLVQYPRDQKIIIMMEITEPIKIIKINPHYQRSQAMTQILGGKQSHPNCSHYIDAIDRFKRDFAQHDKQARKIQRQVYQQKLNQRRVLKVSKETMIKSYQIEQLQKQNEKFGISRNLYNLGMKKTTQSTGLPVNPITLEYYHNRKGEQLRQKDIDKKLNQLARTKHLQKCGNSPFNLIDGSSNIKIQTLVQSDHLDQFQRKVSEYDNYYRIRL